MGQSGRRPRRGEGIAPANTASRQLKGGRHRQQATPHDGQGNLPGKRGEDVLPGPRFPSRQHAALHSWNAGASRKREAGHGRRTCVQRPGQHAKRGGRQETTGSIQCRQPAIGEMDAMAHNGSGHRWRGADRNHAGIGGGGRVPSRGERMRRHIHSLCTEIGLVPPPLGAGIVLEWTNMTMLSDRAEQNEQQ